MAFSNTYSEFKSQYELKKTAGLFADALTQFQNAAGQPIFANEEGTPLRNLLNQLDLQPAQQAPPYDFELQNHVTFNQIQAACNQRGVPITGIIRTVSGRSMYDYTYGQPLPNNVEDPNPWREFSRPEAAERTVEIAQLTFYGDSTTIVDWAETMEKLKALFKARIYTSEMAKTCLMNMVHKYHPEQAAMLRQLTANQIATHLLLLDSNRDKKTYIRTQLYKVFRDPEEDLPAALAKAQLLINGVYPDNDPAYTAQRQAAFRTAVLSFCHDTIAAGVLEKIQHHQRFCLPLTDAEIRDYATKFEEHTHVRPTSRLLFGREINKIPAGAFVQLNSNNMSINTIYPAYPAYTSPYADPYQAYPYYEQDPLVQNNNFNPPPHEPVVPNQQLQIMQNMQNRNGPQHIPNQQAILRPVMNPHGIRAPADPFANVRMPYIPRITHQVAPTWPENQAIPLPAPNQTMPPAALTPAAAAAMLPPTQNLTPLFPDQDWLKSLPFSMQQMRSPEMDSFHTPDTHSTPVQTPLSAHKQTPQTPLYDIGNKAVSNLRYIPTPSKSVDYTELPTDCSVFVQHNRTLAQIGNELVLVNNHPEEIIPVNLSEHFQHLALRTPLKSEGKQKEPEKRTLAPTRASTRERRPPDFYQADFNAIIPVRGFVDPKGQYKPYSRDVTPSRPSSQQYNRSDSRNRSDPRSRLRTPSNDRNSYRNRYPSNDRKDYYNRDNSRSRNNDRNPPSRDRNDSRNRYESRNYSSSDRNSNRNESRNRYPDQSAPQNKAYRSQSPSPYRSKSPSNNAENRQSRTPYKNDYNSSRTDHSSSLRKIYNLIQNGINCRSSYNPKTMKNCTKCMKNDHHEFECSKYFLYDDNKCSFCSKMNHRSQDCKEIKEFPPKIYQKN